MKSLVEIKPNQEKHVVQIPKVVDPESFKKLNKLAFESRERLESTHRRLKENIKT
jgi:hypothetical protein